MKLTSSPSLIRVNRTTTHTLCIALDIGSVYFLVENIHVITMTLSLARDTISAAWQEFDYRARLLVIIFIEGGNHFQATKLLILSLLHTYRFLPHALVYPPSFKWF